MKKKKIFQYSINIKKKIVKILKINSIINDILNTT
jgi:hypothetical protein